jgi:stress-induced morphogen
MNDLQVFLKKNDINDKIQNKIKSTFLKILSNALDENDLDKTQIINKYMHEKVCCFIKSNGKKCSTVVMATKFFCKTHVKHEKLIKQFLEPEITSVLPKQNAKKENINTSGYTKVFLDSINSFVFTKDYIIFDENLYRIGTIHDNDFIIDCDPFL